MINPCASSSRSSSRRLFAVCSSSLLLLVVFGYDNNRSLFSTAMNVAATTSSSIPIQVTECAIVGVGVLGTRICKQLLRDPDFKDWKFTGITKSTTRHDEILKEVLEGDDDNQYSNRFELRTAAVHKDSDENTTDDTIKINKKFKHCVFCAPPSGFDDYPSAIRGAIDDLWMGQHTDDGSFIFTSSGGVYGIGGDSIDAALITTESTPLPTNPIPRIGRIINAENEVLKEKGGSVMRLAGLYLLNRGAHNFWLGNTAEETKDEITSRPDSLINLLHYEDAAGAVVAALKHNINSRQEQDDDEEKRGEIFLVSDGHPLTRQQICESSLKNKRYDGRTIPKFTGSKEKGDLIGKVYDGSYTNKVLNWKPRYESFDTFMSS